MYELQTFDIRNGIRLFYINDSKYKTVSVAAYLHRPISREEVTKNALLAGVLKSATANYSSMKDISRHLEDMYGTAYDVSVSRRGSVQSIVSACSVIKPQIAGENLIPSAIELVFEFLLNPAVENGGFIEKITETEKKNLKDSIESLINDKRAYADFRCMEEMCRGESAGINEYGYVEDLPKINSQNLYDHYKSIITKSPIDIFAIGECDIERIRQSVAERVSELEFDISPIDIEACNVGAVKEKTIEESFDVAQGKLALGLRTFIGTDSELYYPLLVGNSVLGAGAHSKLFNNVREKSSLAYYVSSRLDKYSQVMLISSGIEFKNYERAKKEILQQLEDVKKGEFTSDELEISKDFIINQYRSYFDSPYMMRSFYIGQLISGKGDSIEEAIENVNKVTAEQVCEAMKKITLDTVYFLKGREDK